VPVSGSGWNNTIVVHGQPQKQNVNFNQVGPGYFGAMATPTIAGRDFDARDTTSSGKVVIVTERFARTFFAGENPVGATFQIEEGQGVDRSVHEIVGLVKDAKYTNLREEFTPIVFLAATQEAKPDPYLEVVLRSGAPLPTLTREIADAVTNAHPAAILQFETMNTLVRESLLRERLMASLSGFFGLLAVLLATIGLYGVMSYMVERRRNEIGIRIALGADRAAVVAMVMREAVTLVAAVGRMRWSQPDPCRRRTIRSGGHLAAYS